MVSVEQTEDSVGVAVKSDGEQGNQMTSESELETKAICKEGIPWGWLEADC